MSVCDPVSGMHAMFPGLLPQHVFADRPPADPARVTTRPLGCGRSSGWPRSTRTSSPAIIVEPVLQGAGGMYVYDPGCLTVMREVADGHDLVLVLDEIATGFGRTGTLFAAEHAGVVPDVMCVGKALTGGYLTLAAVLSTGRVAQGIAAWESGVLMHGPTFMGNPLACAVAFANLDLLTGATGRPTSPGSRPGSRQASARGRLSTACATSG